MGKKNGLVLKLFGWGWQVHFCAHWEKVLSCGGRSCVTTALLLGKNKF